MSSPPPKDGRQRRRVWSERAVACLAVGLPLVSGWALGAVFDGHLADAWTWVALVPLMMAARRPRVSLGGWLGVWLAGIVFHFWGLSWLREMESSLVGPHSTWWFLLATVQGTAWPISVFVTRDLHFRLRCPWCCAAGLGWMVGEFARFHLWALVDEVGTPWLQLALAQVELAHLLQVADLGGAWLVSGLVAGANALWIDLALLAPALFPARRPVHGWNFDLPPLTSLVVGGVVAAGIWGYGSWRLGQAAARPGPIVWLMPSASFGRDGPGPEAEFFLSTAAERPDLLVWPEFLWVDLYPRSANADQTAAHLADLRTWSQARDVALILGCNRREDDPSGGREFNSAVVIDRERGPIGWYDKLALVPWQEFTPWWTYTAFRHAPSEFAHGTAAPVHAVWWRAGGRRVSLAATICYDTCFPHVHRRFFREPNQELPEFFLACSSEHLDRELRGQRALLAHARLRAVECRRGIARSVDNGFSALIDANGGLRHVASEVAEQKPTSVGPMPLDDRLSLYRLGGDWLPWAALALWTSVNVPVPRRDRPIRTAPSATLDRAA